MKKLLQKLSHSMRLLNQPKVRTLAILFSQIMIITFLATIPAGCVKNPKTEPTPIDTVKKPTTPVVVIPVNQDPVPNTSKLGYGINITGEYANLSAVRFKVIDIDALYRASKDRIVIDYLSDTRNYSIAGENILAYTKGISAKVSASSGLGLWKASASYFDTTSYRSDYIYSGYNLLIRQRELKFNASLDMLKKNLTPEFTADLSQSPEYLVKKYGTHVLGDILLGAKFECTYRALTANSDRKTAASAGLNVALKEIFDLNVSPSYNASSSSTNTEQQLRYRTIGGSPSVPILGDLTLGATVPNKVQLGQWQASVSESNSQLIDFGSEEPLILLSDLIPDPTKALAVKNYITTYLINSQIKMVDGPVPVYVYSDQSRVNWFYSLDNLPSIGGRFLFGGVAFRAYRKNSMPGLVPVYMHSSASRGDYYLNQNSNIGVLDYVNTGVLCYAYPSQIENSTPIYQFFYSARIAKKDYNGHLCSVSSAFPGTRDWIFAGVPFYAYAP